MKKSCIAAITLIHYKSRQVERDIFSTNQRNDSELTFAAAATKIKLKHLKT